MTRFGFYASCVLVASLLHVGHRGCSAERSKYYLHTYAFPVTDVLTVTYVEIVIHRMCKSLCRCVRRNMFQTHIMIGYTRVPADIVLIICHEYIHLNIKDHVTLTLSVICHLGYTLSIGQQVRDTTISQ